MRLIFICLTFLCSVFSSAQDGYTILSIPAELTQNANSVIIDEVVNIDATNIQKMKITTRRSVAVLNKMGENDTRAHEFYNENSKVRKIKAEVYDALGNRKKKYKKKDFKDVSRSGGSMYVDSRMVYLDYTPTFYPYIMIFESEVVSGDSGLLNSLWFLQGYNESVSKTKMSIQFPPDNPIRYKTKNLDGYDVQISETPEELIITANNIPALSYEKFSPSNAEIFPHIMLAFDKFQLKNVLATVEDWGSFGAWMNEKLLGDVDKVSPETLTKMKQLVSNEETNEAKARKIYQYVQDKVRYVSIQIGIGGWKPTPASEVDELSYGDCKALTNYTKVLLDAVGIPSYYTIVYGNESKQNIEEDFASIQGNHVILGIPVGEDITWLECTSQDLPFGYTGTFTDDRNVVMLTPEGGKLTRTKSYRSTENTQQTKALIKLDTEGNMKVEFISNSEGLQYEDKYFLSKQNPTAIEKYYKNRWSHINGFSIIEYNFNNNREQISFTENLIFDTSNYVNSVGKDFLLTPNIFNRVNYIPPKVKQRKQNLKINRGVVDEDSIIFEIPSAMTFETLPDSKRIETKFGSYEINFVRLSDQRFEYRRKINFKKGEFPPEEYNNYREFIHSMAKLDRTKILLTKKN